jgi:hypothetical protein
MPRSPTIECKVECKVVERDKPALHGNVAIATNVYGRKYLPEDDSPR